MLGHVINHMITLYHIRLARLQPTTLDIGSSLLSYINRLHHHLQTLGLLVLTCRAWCYRWGEPTVSTLNCQARAPACHINQTDLDLPPRVCVLLPLKSY